MRVTLVDNVLMEAKPGGFELELQPHLGLISLVAVLRQCGHDALLFDPKLALVRGGLRLGPAFYAEVAERILAGDPQIVGFTSLGCNFAFTVRIAEQVRAMRPDVPIVLGGPHATIVDREILRRYTQFDIIVRNEAETTIGAVVDALAGEGELRRVDGISYRRDGRPHRNPDATIIADLDSLPLAAYDAYPIDELGLEVLDVDAGRGCPFTCTFCSTATFFGRKYRLKSPARLVDELDTLSSRYGIRKFRLTHDLFTVDKRKVRAFCAAVAPRAYEWSCSARIDCVDASLLTAMREAGCSGIYYGIETGSQRLQPLVGKKLNLSLFDPMIATSLELGLDVTASFITGFPEETPADQSATLALMQHSIERYSDALSLQLHLLTPEPGTGLHAAHSAALAYDGHINDFNFPALQAADDVLIAGDPAVFMCHHHYVLGPGRARNIALTDGFRGLYALGHVLLRAMIGDDPGSFAELLIDYAASSARDRENPAALLRFARERWPREHPFVDAITYLCAQSELDTEVAPPAAALAARPIRLSRRFVPIESARDGAEVLRRLHAALPLDTPELPRTPHLLVADPALASHRVLAADSMTVAVAGCLRRTTTIERLYARFDAAELHSRLWVLAMMGAIVEAEPAGVTAVREQPTRSRSQANRYHIAAATQDAVWT